MKKSMNKTLHSIVDYATNKAFSNYSSWRNKASKMTNRFSSSRNSKVMLYSGIALATAGAVYLLVKNREQVKDIVMDFIAETTGRSTEQKYA